MKKNILFRADSSSLIGTGHIMRDLVLAKMYKNSNIIFATQDLAGNINQKITEAGYTVKILQSNDLIEIIKLIKKFNIDTIVIDNYDINFKYEKVLKLNTNVKIFSFDDTYNKHYCDILLNHNLGANKRKYKHLVPPNCKIMCGSKYTLLRDEFIKEKKKNKHVYNKKNINMFLALGGTDHSNLNIKILKVLKNFNKLKVNIVTTTSNKNLEALEKYVKNKKWINLYINATNIAKIMNKSNFAIVTPSVTLNEVYFMNIPFISIKTASNQSNLYKYLKSKKYPVLKKFSKKMLKMEVKLLLKKINNDR